MPPPQTDKEKRNVTVILVLLFILHVGWAIATIFFISFHRFVDALFALSLCALAGVAGVLVRDAFCVFSTDSLNRPRSTPYWEPSEDS